MLRLITDGKISPEEAVRVYHGVLQAKKIKPRLPLEKDLQSTDQSVSYDGSGKARATVTIRNNPLHRPTDRVAPEPVMPSRPSGASAWPVHANDSPDFSKMDAAQRRAYDADRLMRKFG